MVLLNSGLQAYLLGRWDEAIDLEERSHQALEKIGDRVYACRATYNIADILTERGLIDEAKPLYEDVLRVCKAGGSIHGVGLATSALGRIAARQGQFSEARRYWSRHDSSTRMRETTSRC